MTLLDITILSLATWRLSSFLANDEDGPFEIFSQLRDLIGVRYNETGTAYGENALAEMVVCVWCLSVWVGLGLTVLYLLLPIYTIYLCLPFALSAVAIGINRYVA